MISLPDIYDKNVSFLLGSGASYGILPTLELAVVKPAGGKYSLEELATKFEEDQDRRFFPLFMHYYQAYIRPAQQLYPLLMSADELAVIRNYEELLKTIVSMLQRKPAFEKTCNLFTTNYDGCIALASENLLAEGRYDFVINDGTRGFRTKILQARNFNSYLCNSGVFDRHRNTVPQINLVHLHGSVYWTKKANSINVDYGANVQSLLTDQQVERLSEFSAGLTTEGRSIDDLVATDFTVAENDAFWDAYKKIPIVNPTKWKFHETVYEEHYYQMLRYLSYELEKPNSVLVTFGFSFADEHILNLVMRSLSNPRLQVFVCCFNEAAHLSLSETFKQFRNVKCLKLDEGVMSFDVFNEQVLQHPAKAPDLEAQSVAAPIAAVNP